MDNERIMGARGVHTLEELFADFKPHGKGREFEDLDVVMKKMEHWAHRLFPKKGVGKIKRRWRTSSQTWLAVR